MLPDLSPPRWYQAVWLSLMTSLTCAKQNTREFVISQACLVLHPLSYAFLIQGLPVCSASPSHVVPRSLEHVPFLQTYCTVSLQMRLAMLTSGHQQHNDHCLLLTLRYTSLPSISYKAAPFAVISEASLRASFKSPICKSKNGGLTLTSSRSPVASFACSPDPPTFSHRTPW